LESGEACIGDFGLAHFVQTGDSEYHSSGRKRAGHFRWKAPEILFNDTQQRTCETDVFAFGRMILEILTGVMPLSDWSDGIVYINAQQNVLLPDRPTGEDVGRRGLSDGAWQLISECNEKEPRNRPSISEVVSRLKDEQAARQE